MNFKQSLLCDSRVEGLYLKPIPDLSKLRASQETYGIPINKDDPKYQEEVINVHQNGISGENHYWVMKTPRVPFATHELLVRKSVVTLLLIVNYFLSKAGLEIFVKDALRSVALQCNRYEYELQKKRANFPELTEEELKEKMRDFMSKVPTGKDLLKSPPPHCTGGAIDLVLRDIKSKKFLQMKTDLGQYQPEYFEKLEKERPLAINEKKTQGNRRILYWTMVYAGFAPSPTEWWHFSFGDQMWAEFISTFADSRSAFYGLVKTKC